MAKKKIEVRLTSTPLVNSTGLFRWAVSGYKTKSDRERLAKVISDTYRLKREVAHGLLSGKISTRIQGDVVLFDAEPGSYLLASSEPVPKRPIESLTFDQLADALRQIQSILWLDMGREPERWDPDKEFDSETADAVAGVLHDLGLAPESEEHE